MKNPNTIYDKNAVSGYQKQKQTNKKETKQNTHPHAITKSESPHNWQVQVEK